MQVNFQNTFIKKPRRIAVAVSGGADSMALLHMLSAHVGRHSPRTEIHALTVDHGLRAEAAAEAAQVREWVQDWPHVGHTVLIWKGRKPASSIQEHARRKRYELMAAYCAAHGIDALFLAHHQTDQAETFLFRLAKGSGVDGLGGMVECTPYQDGTLMLMRPLLAVSKDDLLAYCKDQHIPFVNDPSNENRDYARVRLRQSLPVLEAEGLSEKRLATTAMRMQRARSALDFYAGKILRHADVSAGRAVVKMTLLRNAPEEIRLRVVRQILGRLGGDEYGPRLDRLEDLLGQFFAAGAEARAFTLGGFVFRHNVKTGQFIIAVE